MRSQHEILRNGQMQFDPKPRIGDDDGISENALNIALFLSLAVASTAMAQSTLDPALEELTMSAMLDMNENRYNEALDKLLTVQGHAPSASMEHLLGVCYYNMKAMSSAIEHLERATEDMVEEDQSWNPFGEKAPIHALNYLGKVHFDQGNYAQASEAFSAFLVSLYVAKDSEPWLIEWTEEVLTICEEMTQLSVSAKNL